MTHVIFVNNAALLNPQMEAYIDTIVSGLASALLQLQVLPVVVSVQGGAAQVWRNGAYATYKKFITIKFTKL